MKTDINISVQFLKKTDSIWYLKFRGQAVKLSTLSRGVGKWMFLDGCSNFVIWPDSSIAFAHTVKNPL